MQDKVAVVALLLTNVALIIGWVVAGTQRVTEELTRERRETYSELLCCARSVREGGKTPEDLASVVERAELVSSREMYWSKYIPHLEASAQAEEDEWSEARMFLFDAARFESLFNSSTRRLLHRSSVYGLLRAKEKAAARSTGRGRIKSASPQS